MKFLGIVLVAFCVGTLSACSGGDPDPTRTKEQSKQLRDRLSTTQSDR